MQKQSKFGPSGKKRDMRSSGLPGKDLTRVDLSQADLAGADLSGATLIGTNFHKANLVSANFAETELINVNLEEAIIENTDFRRADFKGMRLVGNSFRKCDLRRAKLIGCDLKFTRWVDCDLSGADLTGADFTGADLINCKLLDTQMRRSIMHDADLRGSSLQGGDLSAATFRKANLKNVNLSGTEVREARFWGARGLSRDQVAYLESSGASVDSPWLKRFRPHMRWIKSAAVLVACLAVWRLTDYFRNPAYSSSQNLQRLAYQHFRAGDYEKSLQINKILAERNQKTGYLDRAPHFSMVENYLRLREFDKALAVLENLDDNTEKMPEDAARIITTKAAVYREMGSLERAESLYRGLTASDLGKSVPEICFDAWSRLAELTGQRIGWRGAVAVYREMLENYKREPDRLAMIHQELARLYNEIGKPNEAEKHYREIIAKYGRDRRQTMEAQFGMALIKRQQGDLTGAMKDYEKMLHDFNDKSEWLDRIRLEVARCNQEMNNAEGAATYFRSILKNATDPRVLMEARFWQVALQVERGDYEGAIKVYKQMLGGFEERPEWTARIHLEMGNIYQKLQNLKEAEKNYRRVLKVAPPHFGPIFDSRVALAGIQRMKGDAPGALEAFEMILQEFKERPSRLGPVYRAIGELYLDSGKHQEAALQYKIILEKYPNDENLVFRAHMALAGILVGQGRPEEGIQYMRNLLPKYRGHPEKSRLIQQRLDELNRTRKT